MTCSEKIIICRLGLSSLSGLTQCSTVGVSSESPLVLGDIAGGDGGDGGGVEQLAPQLPLFY